MWKVNRENWKGRLNSEQRLGQRSSNPAASSDNSASGVAVERLRRVPQGFEAGDAKVPLENWTRRRATSTQPRVTCFPWTRPPTSIARTTSCRTCWPASRRCTCLQRCWDTCGTRAATTLETNTAARIRWHQRQRPRRTRRTARFVLPCAMCDVMCYNAP